MVRLADNAQKTTVFVISSLLNPKTGFSITTIVDSCLSEYQVLSVTVTVSKCLVSNSSDADYAPVVSMVPNTCASAHFQMSPPRPQARSSNLPACPANLHGKSTDETCVCTEASAVKTIVTCISVAASHHCGAV